MKRMNKKKEDGRGLSPVIATILLVAMVIVTGAIVFIWMSGSIREIVYKFGDQNIELACDEVAFNAEYYSVDKIIYVVNNGDVPIKKFKIQIISGGNKKVIDLYGKSLVSEDGTFKGLNSGQGNEVDVEEENIGSSDKLFAIPVLEGRTEQGETKDYICDERYGKEVQSS